MEFIYYLFIFLGFILASIVSFYIPGVLLLSWTRLKLTVIENLLIAWVVGISTFLLGTYITSWLHIPFAYEWVLLLIACFALIKKRKLFALQIRGIDWWSLGLVLAGSAAFVSITANSGFMIKEGMQFIGTSNKTDGIMHLAFINSLTTTFPPVHVGLAGYTLRGYHYFYDLLLSRFVLFFHFTPEDLHYRLFPILMSLIYGSGFYLFTKSITKNKVAFPLVLFFAYFAQSSAFIYSLLNRSVSLSDGLGVIQPIELILDPSVVLSIGMLLIAVYFLLKIEKSILAGILVGIILGTMSELKVYVGVIGIAVVSFYMINVYFQKKNVLPYVVAFLTTGILTAATFLPNNLGAAGLWFSPFFIYESFMQERVFAQMHWEVVKIIYQQHHNTLRLIQMFGFSIVWYWLMALGLRLVFIFGVMSLVKKRFWKNDGNRLFIVIVLTPIVIGSLFVQSISIFDTKQFFWIAAALFAIPAGVVLANMWIRLPMLGKFGVVILLFWYAYASMVFQIGRFAFAQSYTQLISNNQLAVYNKISQVVPLKDFIIVVDKKPLIDPPNVQYHPSPIVAAYTKRVTYYEPEVAQFALTDVMQKRKEAVWELTQALKICDTSKVIRNMKQIGSPYLVTFQSYSCIVPISLIHFGTEGLYFYKVIQ